jgi:hypothetical protein
MKSAILRQRLTFFISLTTTIAWGQFASLSDSLLSPSAEWYGDTAFMNFTQDGLRSNAPAAGSLLWSRPSSAGLDAVWEITIQMEFNPSSANFSEFRFLQKGSSYYALRCGGGLADDLSLYLHHGYNDTTLAVVPGFVNQSKPLVKLRVERDSSANFTVYAADSLLFIVNDSTLLRSTTLSIYCKYTSTRVDKFLFSTLHASGYDFPDTLGPECKKIDVLDPFTLSVTWNEWAELTPFPDRNYALVYSAESVDTAYVVNHFDEQWHLSLTQPLVQGALGVLLPNAQDADGNVAAPFLDSIQVSYAKQGDVWVSAIHPFKEYGGFFIVIQALKDLGTSTMSILEDDGEVTSYSIRVDSGTTVLGSTYISQYNNQVIPQLDLPSTGVIIIEKAHITLAAQHYKNIFMPNEIAGDFMLRADSISGIYRQFSVYPLNTYTPNVRPLSSPKPNELMGFYADPTGLVYGMFAYNAFPYLKLPGANANPSELALSFQSFSPFFLPTGLSFPPGLGGTSLDFSPCHYPDSGQLFFSEVHFNPDTMNEFIELYNAAEDPLFIDNLQVVKYSGYSIMDADKLTPDFSPFDGHPLSLRPVIVPQQHSAFNSPFSLSNDTTRLVLSAPFGQVIDELTYPPHPTSSIRLSIERISFQYSGKNLSNWGNHHPKWCCPTEASPNKANSISSTHTFSDPNITLSEHVISYDPLRYSPTTQLALSVAAGSRLSVSVTDFSGRPIYNIMQNEPLVAGDHLIEIRPTNWINTEPPTGIYVLHIYLKTSQKNTWKKIPLSIYNP